MTGVNDIVITGLGCVTPIGIGKEAFAEAIRSRQCAVQKLYTLDNPERTSFYAAAIDDFNPKLYVTPRKAIKVMSREVQTAYAAAHLAWQDGQLENAELDPDRVGVVYGSEMIPGAISDLADCVRACDDDGQLNHSKWGTEFSRQVYPLWMLKNLPNMPACHVGIAIDARGPNNTICQEEASSLLALIEAAMVIERDQTDLMVVGGVGGRVSPTRMTYRAIQLYDQHPYDDQATEDARCIPFDQRRRGIVAAEGSGACVIERRSHAARRGANIIGKVCGYASRCARPETHYGGSWRAISSAAEAALEMAGISAADLNHVCAQGYSHKVLDAEEAQAITKTAPNTPVVAYSSYFGTAGAASGMLEIFGSLTSMRAGKLHPTLGFQEPDEACPISVVTEAQDVSKPHFLKLSFTPFGHAAAVVIEAEN